MLAVSLFFSAQKHTSHYCTTGVVNTNLAAADLSWPLALACVGITDSNVQYIQRQYRTDGFINSWIGYRDLF